MKSKIKAWLKRGGVVFVIPLFAALSAVPAVAQSEPGSDKAQLQQKLDQLEQQIKELQAQLGAQDNAAPNAGPAPVPAEASPEDSKPPEKKTKFDIYGFIMLDSGYDFNTNH